MDSFSAPDPSAVASLKDWMRTARRKAGFTQPQLAKRMDVETQDVFRWEHRHCDDLPDKAQLVLMAHLVGTPLPYVPPDVLPDPPPAMIEATERAEVDWLEPISDIAALKRWMRTVRKRAGLTQAALADSLEIAAVTVHKWENLDAPEYMPWPAIAQVAEACGVAVPAIDESLALRGRWVAPAPLEPEFPVADTLLAEIEQTAARLAYRYEGRETQTRNAQLFVEHYGRGRNLKVIGDEHGLTRERVRQVVSRMMQVLPSRQPPRAKFMELVERCKDMEPTPLERAEHELADLLGGVPLSAAIIYGAHVLGVGLPIEVDTSQSVPMVVPRGMPNWVTAAIRHARRMIRFNGAALFDQVWAATQREHESRISHDALGTALQSVHGFTWLDPTKQWFWFGPEKGSNRVLDWSRRMLASAQRRVDVEHVHSGLARFTALYDEESRTTAVMPTPEILLAMLRACPDIAVLQSDDLKLIDPSNVPAVESDSVLDHLLEVLRGQGGVMARSDIVEQLVEGRGLVPISLSIQLARSPLIRRLDHGIYAIRGWQLSHGNVARAWRRNLSPSSTDIEFGVDGSFAWDMTLSDAAIRNDRVYLPSSISPKMPMGPLATEGGEVRVVGAQALAQLRGLGALALSMGGQPGDRFRITVWPERRTLRLEPI